MTEQPFEVYLGGGWLDQVNSLVSFAELVVARRWISEDFNPIRTHLNMGAEGERKHSNIQIFRSQSVREEIVHQQNNPVLLYLLGFQSSAHISVPMQVSFVERTQSPNGTVSWRTQRDSRVKNIELLLVDFSSLSWSGFPWNWAKHRWWRGFFALPALSPPGSFWAGNTPQLALRKEPKNNYFTTIKGKSNSKIKPC